MALEISAPLVKITGKNLNEYFVGGTVYCDDTNTNLSHPVSKPNFAAFRGIS